MKLVTVAALLAVALAEEAYRPSPVHRAVQAEYTEDGYGQPATHPEVDNHYQSEEHADHPYNFSYAVHDEASYNDFGHEESNDGKVVTGSYRVLLPDGRTQTVTYTVDGYSGYVAHVTYEGEAKYPEYNPTPAYHSPAYDSSAYDSPAYDSPAYDTSVTSRSVPSLARAYNWMGYY